MEHKENCHHHFNHSSSTYRKVWQGLITGLPRHFLQERSRSFDGFSMHSLENSLIDIMRAEQDSLKGTLLTAILTDPTSHECRMEKVEYFQISFTLKMLSLGSRRKKPVCFPLCIFMAPGCLILNCKSVKLNTLMHSHEFLFKMTRVIFSWAFN